MKNNKNASTNFQSFNSQKSYKANNSAYFPHRNQIQNNQTNLLNKSQSKKLELTNISSSLSLKKDKSKGNTNTVEPYKEGKVNPENRNIEPKLTKATSTDKFILRNAMYIRQKALKIENQQRKKLCRLDSDCRFIPQIQISKHYQKCKAQDSPPPETEKFSNLGKYQLNYHKKLQYQQFGYIKKPLHLQIKNKDIKKLLKQSVERFNKKLNQQQQVEETKIVENRGNKLSQTELNDANKNLIWISCETDQKYTRQDQINGLIPKQQEDLTHHNYVSIKQTQDWIERDKQHLNSQILTQLKQNNSEKSEIKQDEGQLQYKNGKCILEDIHDISDIPNQEYSSNESDLINSHIQQIDPENMKESEQIDLPKCFKKQNQREFHYYEIKQTDSFTQQNLNSKIAIKQTVNVEENEKKQVELQMQTIKVTQVNLDQISNEEEPQLEFIDFEVYSQQPAEHKVQQLDFKSIIHPYVQFQNTFLQEDEFQTNLENQVTEEVDTKEMEVEQTLKNQNSPQIVISYDQGYQQVAKDQQIQRHQQKQYQSFVIDDFGNVIMKNTIQIHSVGFCNILVIPELPQQQARSSYS